MSEKSLSFSLVGKGVKEDITSKVGLQVDNNINFLIFESNKLLWKLILKDMVDVDDYIALMQHKTKKQKIHCYLRKDGKDYSGERIIKWKGNKLVLSIGAYRFEFKDVETLLGLGTFVRNRYNKQ